MYERIAPVANFLVVIDPDREQRSKFVKTIEPLVSPMNGLKISSTATGDFCALWAAHDRAPVASSTDDEGAAVLWGHAISRAEPQKLDAEKLKFLWRDCAEPLPRPLDGYHAAVVYRAGLGVTVGADLLGLFPV